MDGSGSGFTGSPLAEEAAFARDVAAMVDTMTPQRERFTPWPRYFELQAFNFMIMRRQLQDLFPLDRRYPLICEIGCGAGMHSALLARFCEQMHGFDIPGEYAGYTPPGFASSAGVARAVCEILGVGNARFDDAFPGALPLDAGSVDLMFSWTVLEHVPELASAFAEMYRVMRPGGAMVHVVPNTMSAIHTIAGVNVDRPGTPAEPPRGWRGAIEHLWREFRRIATEGTPATPPAFVTPELHSEFLRPGPNYNAQLNLYIAWEYLHPMMRQGFVFERLAVVNDFNYALVLRRP